MEGASKLKYFKPCLKHYLTRQIRTRLALVPAPEWEIAAFLPTANFSTPTGRQGVERVYSDSRGML